jgi:hypothetical protein
VEVSGVYVDAVVVAADCEGGGGEGEGVVDGLDLDGGDRESQAAVGVGDVLGLQGFVVVRGDEGGDGQADYYEKPEQEDVEKGAQGFWL